MSTRTDSEVRVYLTGRPGGQIEWQVVVIEDDGQASWSDGQVSAWGPGRNVVPPELVYVVGRELRKLSRAIRELPTPS